MILLLLNLREIHPKVENCNPKGARKQQAEKITHTPRCQMPDAKVLRWDETLSHLRICHFN